MNVDKVRTLLMESRGRNLQKDVDLAFRLANEVRPLLAELDSFRIALEKIANERTYAKCIGVQACGCAQHTAARALRRGGQHE